MSVAKQEQFIIRFPDGMRDRIRQTAEENRRSMNSEIIALLEEALEHRHVSVVDDIVMDIVNKRQEFEGIEVSGPTPDSQVTQLVAAAIARQVGKSVVKIFKDDPDYLVRLLQETDEEDAK